MVLFGILVLKREDHLILFDQIIFFPCHFFDIFRVLSFQPFNLGLQDLVFLEEFLVVGLKGRQFIFKVVITQDPVGWRKSGP